MYTNAIRPTMTAPGETDINIVDYDLAFRDQILALETTLWGNDRETNSAYFDWKYERNPQSDRRFFYVALSDGRVVGVKGFSGSRWQVGHSGRVFDALQPGDFVVSPDLRGRGVGKKLMNHIQQDLIGRGYEFAFSFGALAATYFLQVNHLGWRRVAEYQTMRRRTEGTGRARFFRALDQRLNGVLARMPVVWRAAGRYHFAAIGGEGGLSESANKFPAGCRVGGSGHVVVDDRPRPAQMAGLINRLADDGRITRVRDEAFFAWRFDNPRFCFRFLFWQGERIEGYLVLSANLWEGPRMTTIADWEASCETVAKALIEAAVDCAESDSLMLWSLSLSPDRLKIAKDAGFRHVDDSGGNKGYNPGIQILPLSLNRSNDDLVFAGTDFADPAAWNMRLLSANNF